MKVEYRAHALACNLPLNYMLLCVRNMAELLLMNV